MRCRWVAGLLEYDDISETYGLPEYIFSDMKVIFATTAANRISLNIERKKHKTVLSFLTFAPYTFLPKKKN